MPWAASSLATIPPARRYRRSTTLGIDLAVPMLKLARKAGGFWRPLSVACGDAAALPLPDASVDLLFSSLCLQWLDDVPAVLNEFRRVLRPGGRMMLATFGPQTLIELRDAWAQMLGQQDGTTVERVRGVA